MSPISNGGGSIGLTLAQNYRHIQFQARRLGDQLREVRSANRDCGLTPDPKTSRAVKTVKAVASRPMRSTRSLAATLVAGYVLIGGITGPFNDAVDFPEHVGKLVGPIATGTHKVGETIVKLLDQSTE